MYRDNTTTKQNSALLEDETCQLLTGEQHTRFQKSTVLYSLGQIDDALLLMFVKPEFNLNVFVMLQNGDIELDDPTYSSKIILKKKNIPVNLWGRRDDDG